MATKKPTNTLLQFGGILLGLGGVALLWNLLTSLRTYFNSDAAGFDFGLFLQVFGYSPNWFMTIIVWAPAVLIPIGLIVYFLGMQRPRDRYADGTPVEGTQPGAGSEFHPHTEFQDGTGVHPGNPNAFGTAESHTDRKTDEPR